VRSGRGRWASGGKVGSLGHLSSVLLGVHVLVGCDGVFILFLAGLCVCVLCRSLPLFWGQV
jgi:hypothetical protein